MKAWLKIEKIDNDMKVISSSQVLSESFLVAFLGVLQRQFAQLTGTANKTYLADILGETRLGDRCRSPIFCCTAGSGWFMPYYGADYDSPIDAEEMGLVVGISPVAVTCKDRKLVSRIHHGVLSGELLRFGTHLSNWVQNGITCSFDIECIFRNSGSGDVVIQEVGLYGLGSSDGAYESGLGVKLYTNFGFIRDVVAPETISIGEYVRVAYTLEID